MRFINSTRYSKPTGANIRTAWHGAVLGVISVLAASGCAFHDGRELAADAEDGGGVAELLSPNPCTSVTMTSPTQNFTITRGVPILLTGAATCPTGQTPEYQYWVKLFSASNWTVLGPYVPGSSSWTPPSDDHWCVTVVTRAIGAPEYYQARAAARCNIPHCGNGALDPGEQCDDGNTVNGDGCDSNCTFPRCGNGVIDSGEQCDDGNAANGDACETDCTRPRCGNGIVDVGEQCDDGNSVNGDACDTNCTMPRCGNGAVDPGEQCDDGNAVNGDACDTNCTTPRCGNAIVDPNEQCDDGNAVNGDACTNSCAINGITYIKASNTGQGDFFATSVALSADGSTLAVGAVRETSAATGIGGNQTDDSAPFAGAVYIFMRSGTTWSQQAYIKASNTGSFNFFGVSVALSANGSILAVGASGEESAATGIDGNQDDNSASIAGAVYLFTRSGTTWSQQAYVKASNTNPHDYFGSSVALSADGMTLAVGAFGEDSAATGIGGYEGDNSATYAGAVYIFTRNGTTWSQQAYVKASNTGANDLFGTSVALSTDGTTLAVSAYGEASAATGITGNQSDNSASAAGAVYVFARNGTTWSQQAYVKASNTDRSDFFGWRIALSADGLTLAVGAFAEASAATGIGGNQGDNSASNAGAVYVFTRSGTTWSQQAYVKASNTAVYDQFGGSLALSGDGTKLAVGAALEDSRSRGIAGDQGDNSAPEAGAVYMFTRTGATWNQQAYVKASNTASLDEFGYSVALSADGTTLAVGATGDRSSATGVNGDQFNNFASDSGAVYVFR
jgi:cysteine-rich repeat protein